MRCTIAVAAIMAVSSADLASDLEKAGNEMSCGIWKSSVAFGKPWTRVDVGNT